MGFNPITLNQQTLLICVLATVLVTVRITAGLPDKALEHIYIPKQLWSQPKLTTFETVRDGM